MLTMTLNDDLNVTSLNRRNDYVSERRLNCRMEMNFGLFKNNCRTDRRII